MIQLMSILYTQTTVPPLFIDHEQKIRENNKSTVVNIPHIFLRKKCEFLKKFWALLIIFKDLTDKRYRAFIFTDSQ